MDENYLVALDLDLATRMVSTLAGVGGGLLTSAIYDFLKLKFSPRPELSVVPVNLEDGPKLLVVRVGDD